MRKRGGRPIRIAFAGGGSGGHLYPQIAVAGEIRKLRPEAEIYFVSARGSIEEKLVPPAGYELVLIPSGKLKGQRGFALLRSLFRLSLSFFVCSALLLRRRPDRIFSAGGFAGAPFLVVGALFGVRCEILEQNRVSGLANRWMARFCARVYLNFAGTGAEFPRKETPVVGHPCRPEIEAARWGENELPEKMRADPFRIFVFGGSQGALGLNRIVTAAAGFLRGLNVEILHQSGEADFARVQQEYSAAGFSRVSVEKFIFDMASTYPSAQLVICRAGASSIAELAAAGKAAILIPLLSADRHQEPNAEEVVKLSAGLAFPQKQLTGEGLAAILKELYNDREKLVSFAKNMGALHQPEAALRIAKGILEG